jgi:hypothetical protein
MIDVRVRTAISDQELGAKLGKVLTPADYNLALTGPARVRKPDGSLLCVYLPGELTPAVADEARPVLHSLRGVTTNNRGLASGSPTIQLGQRKRMGSQFVRSAIVGAFDPSMNHAYCRLTAWTGAHLPQLVALLPLLQAVARAFEREVPDRYAVQAALADQTDPAWRFEGTPFSTVTVNNTYPTGVHVDDGDLAEGFSTIACLRMGTYAGGVLVFPRLRVGIDLGDRDVVLMDAHEWHGNTSIEGIPGAERISVVSYYRTQMSSCGTPAEEHAKALADAGRRSARGGGAKSGDPAWDLDTPLVGKGPEA